MIPGPMAVAMCRNGSRLAPWLGPRPCAGQDGTHCETPA